MENFVFGQHLKTNSGKFRFSISGPDLLQEAPDPASHKSSKPARSRVPTCPKAFMVQLVPHGRAGLGPCGVRKWTKKRFGLRTIWGPAVWNPGTIWDQGHLGLWDHLGPSPLGSRSIWDLDHLGTWDLGPLGPRDNLGPSHLGSGPWPRDLGQGERMSGKAWEFGSSPKDLGQGLVPKPSLVA